MGIFLSVLLIFAYSAAGATDCAPGYAQIQSHALAAADFYADPEFQAQLRSNPRTGEKRYWFHYNNSPLALRSNTYFSSDPVQLFPWGTRLYVAKLNTAQRGAKYFNFTQELVAYKIIDKGNKIVSMVEVADINELKKAVAAIDRDLARVKKSAALKNTDSVAKDMDLTLFVDEGPTQERIAAVLRSWKTKSPEESRAKSAAMQSLAEGGF